ncbi:transglutaminase domain-containing protein [Fluviicola sp.]|uniref:transglutaminase domain-containing protein n=1 Tax=Fluviicola sp. TaxID=1917219 RepID=UPI003D28CF72
MKNLLIILLLFCRVSAFGQNQTGIFLGKELDTTRLNKIAQLASKEDRSWNKVSHLIGDSCKTELERVYTIYSYIAGSYKYDLNRLKLIYKREIKRELYLSEVIKKKKGVCGDFANLFVTLCDSLDIGCFRVSGYSRSFNLFHPVRKNYYNHAWNVVRVDGNWYVLDVTFGMQHFTKKKFDKEQIDYDFLFTDPVKFGIIHLPADPAFQLVNQERSYKDFRYHRFLWRISNTNEIPPGDSILNQRLNKDWKDQLLDEAFAAQLFNKKVKGASLKLLEVRINKVLDKKTKRKQLLFKADYENAIYLYQQIQQNLIENHAKKKYIKYTNYRILKLGQERDKLKK